MLLPTMGSVVRATMQKRAREHKNLNTLENVKSILASKILPTEKSSFNCEQSEVAQFANTACKTYAHAGINKQK